MGSEPTQEQVKKFWEWCGFCVETDNHKGYHWEFGARCPDWLTPDGQTSGGNHGIGKGRLPPIDLNCLFKYTVPKLIPLDGTGQGGIEFRVYPGGIHCLLALITETGLDEITYFLENGHDPALALFWAIWEVINGK